MKSLFTIIFIIITTLNLKSQVLLTENFNATIGTKITDKGWAAHSAGGTNPIVTAATLSYLGYADDGAGSASVMTSGEDLNRTFAAAKTESIYVSFMINVSAAQDAGDYFFHLGPATIGTTFRGKVFVKKNGTGFNIGVTKASNTPNYATTVYELNKTYLIVMKYTFKSTSTTDDDVMIYVNPALDKEPSTATNATPTGETDLEDAGSVALRQGSAVNAPTVKVDGIKIGRKWEDLTSNTSSSVASVEKQTLPKNNFFTLFMSSSSRNYGNFEPLSFTYNINNPISKIRTTLNVLRFENSSREKIISVEKPARFQFKDTFSLILQDTQKPFEGNDTLKIYVDDKLLYSEILKVNILIDNSPNSVSISTIKKLGTLNPVLKEPIRGRVTSVSQINDLIYIQDQTGGIPIYLNKSTGIQSNLKLVVGDSVLIAPQSFTFGLDNAQGHLFLKPIGAEINLSSVGSPNKPYLPKSVKINELAQNEGSLVSIQNVSFTDKKFVFLPNTNYTLAEGTNTAVARIWESTDIEGRTIPQGNFNITGVVGRFNNTFQVYPRSQADIPSSGIFQVPASAVTADKTLDVVTWNIEWFGSTGNGPTDEILQQNNVKRVLDSLKADLYVFEEVSNATAFDNLMAKLPTYKGICSSAFSVGATPADAQRVCFAYKTSDLSLIETKVLLKNTTTIANYPDTFDRFWASGRLPFLGVFDANIDGIKRRINVVGIHARANTASDVANKERIFQQRRIDVEVLKDSLDKFYDKEMTLLAGDFNDDLDENVVDGISTKESSYKKFVDDTQKWLPITKKLSEAGFRSYISQPNVIDHIIVNDKMKGSYLVNSETVLLPFTYVSNYQNTTSDHLPVKVRFKLEAPVLSNEKELFDGAFIYPNPTSGAFEIQSSGMDENVAVDLQLFNTKGNSLLVQRGIISEMKPKVESYIQNLAEGLYLLKIQQNNHSKTFKILKK